MGQDSPRVLVVEDSALVSGALRTILEEGGYRVRIADSVAAARSALREERTDLMLLDLGLPDGDGLDVMRRARADGSAPTISIALTGHDDDAIRKQCLEAGCRDVLLKPVSPRELVSRIRDWLGDVA